MATRLDIHTHTCNHYNFFCFFLSYLSLSPAKDYRAASNVCFLWWECLFIEASVVESKGTPMQRQAKPVWIYLYWAWPTSAVRANTWLHPCVRLRGWGGGGLCIRQGGQRVRDVENVETGIYDCLSGSEPQEYHISATEESRLRQKCAVCRSVGAVYFCNCSERGQL